MIVSDIRRFFRSNPLLSVSGIAVLGLGFGLSALAGSFLLALSSLVRPGLLASRSYATVAEETVGGGSARISWNRISQLQLALPPRVTLVAYSEAAKVTLRAHRTRISAKVSGAGSGLFTAFTDPLAAGRDFYRSENAGASSVILSFPLAVQLFGAPSAAIGQVVEITGEPFEVIGVAPARFRGVFADTEGGAVNMWVPPGSFFSFIATLPDPQSRRDVWKDVALFYGVSSAEHGSSPELASELEKRLPLASAGESRLHVSQGLTSEPEQDARIRRYFRLGLLMAVMFTLVVSLNYSLLMLSRMPQLATEVSLKTALGAGLQHIFVELLAGPLAMTAASMLVAIGIVVLGKPIILSRVAAYRQVVLNSWHTTVEALALQWLFALALTLIISGLPAIKLLASRKLAIGSHRETRSRHRGYWLQFPVALQIALCMCVWTLAGMILASFFAQQRQPGYVPAGVTVVQGGQITESVTGGGKGDSFPPANALHTVLNELESIPGVTSASFTTSAPMDGQPIPAISVEDQNSSSGAARYTAYVAWVGANYFDTMKTRILKGHGFTPSQTSNSRDVVLSDVLARELFPKGDAVNRNIRLLYPTMSGVPAREQTVTVAGVVENMRDSGATGGSPGPRLFFSADGSRFFTTAPEFVVRGTETVAVVHQTARRTIRALVPGLDAVSSYSLMDSFSESLRPEKTRAEAAIAASLIMIFLTLVGVHGSLLYFALSRRGEFAIRVCLGSSWWRLRLIVIRRAMFCICAAVIFSMPCWLVLSRLSFGEFLGTISWSTTRAGSITAVCGLVCLGISLVAARTVSQVAPAETLKRQ